MLHRFASSIAVATFLAMSVPGGQISAWAAPTDSGLLASVTAVASKPPCNPGNEGQLIAVGADVWQCKCAWQGQFLRCAWKLIFTVPYGAQSGDPAGVAGVTD